MRNVYKNTLKSTVFTVLKRKEVRRRNDNDFEFFGTAIDESNNKLVNIKYDRRRNLAHVVRFLAHGFYCGEKDYVEQITVDVIGGYDDNNEW